MKTQVSPSCQGSDEAQRKLVCLVTYVGAWYFSEICHLQCV